MGSVNLSASFPLSHPTLEKYDVRGHVFLSVGNLGNVEVGDLYSPGNYFEFLAHSFVASCFPNVPLEFQS